MENLMRVLMLGVVMFALTSVPAPVDQTLERERDGVSAELFELNSAHATVDSRQGLGGAIAGLVLSAPVAAQNGGNGGGSTACRWWCGVLPGEDLGSMCELHYDDPHFPKLSGPHYYCVENTEPTEQDCLDAFEDPDCARICEPDDSFDCPLEGNGGSNGGAGPDGGAATGLSGVVSSSGLMTSRIVSGGVVRDPCTGWVVGVAVSRPVPSRLLL
jgi:hypothetical protein